MGIPVTVQPPVPPAIIVPAETYAAGRTVSFGLPVAIDSLDGSHISARSGGLTEIAQTRILSTWPNGDPKWILVSFPVHASGAAPRKVDLQIVPGPAAASEPLAVALTSRIVVTAAGTHFSVPTFSGYGLVDRIVDEDGSELGLPGGPAVDLVATDVSGTRYRAWRDSVWVIDNGPHRAVIGVKGRFMASGRTILGFAAEIEFDAKRPGPIVRMTIQNVDPTMKKNVRVRSCVLECRLDVGGDGFAVRSALPGSVGDWRTTSDTTIIQGKNTRETRGATSSHFKGPENLRDGYWITSLSGDDASFPARLFPETHWVIAGNGRNEAFGSTRHMRSNWGGFSVRSTGALDIELFSEAQGPHTFRYGSWDTRESLLLVGDSGSIRGSAEAFAFEYPRLARIDNPARWNVTGAYPVPLSSLEEREAFLASTEGAAQRDLRTCRDEPYRVRYRNAGLAGGPNQWDAAHDYWFAWASTGDPNAWLIAEAWADYRTDRAVPHAGRGIEVNPDEFPVTDEAEVFDNSHRHSHYLPIWYLQTGQLRFQLAAHDEFASIYGSSRISSRYMESRITSRLIELGALFAAFERDLGSPDAGLLYERVGDYLRYMLDQRWDFDAAGASAGWANEPGQRDRDPRTFWAASPGKGDQRSDVSFMVASLVPHALQSWLENAPPDDPLRGEVGVRLVDVADFTWEYLISKSVNPEFRGIFFDFDTRRGVGPAVGFGELGFDMNDLPELYHPLYESFTAAFRVTGDRKYLGYGAYWAAGQTQRNAPWVTFHRPDFQSLVHESAR